MQTSETAPLKLTLCDIPNNKEIYNCVLFPAGEDVPCEEYEYYKKVFPTVDVICERKVHCTVCKEHIGVALAEECNINMHPILRVTLCNICLRFYHTGEFDKGEDGSELYCRWCGQGGDVYCCSTCPFVFCKKCITRNLSAGVVEDIENNDNWSCFRCAPKIIWPLRAYHWALMAYFSTKKKVLETMNLSPAEMQIELERDYTTCCQISKAKENKVLSGSNESLHSRRSSSSPKKQVHKSNDNEIVCTPDLSSFLQNDGHSNDPQNMKQRIGPLKFAPLRPRFGGPQQQAQILTVGNKPAVPPPLVLSSTSVRLVPKPVTNQQLIHKQNTTRPIQQAARYKPLYYNINGFTIDLNSASLHDTVKLPNGKSIQVRRKHPQTHTNSNSWPTTNTTRSVTSGVQNNNNKTLVIRPVMRQTQLQQSNQQQQQRIHRINTNSPASSQVTNTKQIPWGLRKSNLRVIQYPQSQVNQKSSTTSSRNLLQKRATETMEFLKSLTDKYTSFINSPAFNEAHSLDDIKATFTNLAYLTSYSIGRLQLFNDAYTGDMKKLGFVKESDMLQSGQLTAAIDFVRFGQLEDIDLTTFGPDSFHNQVYEYRKSLLANIENNKAEGLFPSDTTIEQLLPLFPLNASNSRDLNTANQLQEQVDNDIEADYFYNENESQIDDDDIENNFDIDGNEGNEGNDMNGIGTLRTYTYDRKLGRIIREYPAIWCTRHPDYVNFEKTRLLWREIATNFKPSEKIKLRWKYMRKRFVRMEQRLGQGKRVQSRYDKTLNYLRNRDLSPEKWREVDCGDSDEEAEDITDITDITTPEIIDENSQNEGEQEINDESCITDISPTGNPIEMLPIDKRIINFVENQPVIYRRSQEPQFNKIDEQTRKKLWQSFCETETDYSSEYIRDRWSEIFGMYKIFRLKLIQDKNAMENLELKYKKYLERLAFLHKIDEEDLREEHKQSLETFTDGSTTMSKKLQQMTDDEDFVVELIRQIRKYPCLWDRQHDDYDDTDLRLNAWRNIEHALKSFKRNLDLIKKRWSLASYAYACYRKESERPAPVKRVLEKLAKNLPIAEMQFLDT